MDDGSRPRAEDAIDDGVNHASEGLRALLVINTRPPGREETHERHAEISSWVAEHAYEKVFMVNTSPFTRRDDADTGSRDEVPSEVADWLQVPVPRTKPAVSGDAHTLAHTADRELRALGVRAVDLCGNADDPVFDTTRTVLSELGYTVQVLDALTHSDGGATPGGET